MKTNMNVNAAILIFLSLALLGSCKKEDPTVVTSTTTPKSIKSIAALPEVDTRRISYISTISAKSGGEFIYTNGGYITAKGLCWSTSPNPTTANSKTSEGTGSDSYFSILIGLIPNTTYYVKAYVTNSSGTGYGEERSFKTLLTVNLPTVSTTAVSAITASTANSGGSISNDGGATVTQRGVCWGISDPALSFPNCLKTLNGSGTETFPSSISSLTPNTKYYLRAYASNIEGTGFGNLISFISYPVNIGAPYLGGKLAYILVNSDPGYSANVNHGLIAAISDQSSGAQWGCYEMDLPGADGRAIGTGDQNMWDIIAGCSQSGIAARICAGLVLGGQSDWFLPSRDELDKLYINRNLIGNFASNYYWSSSEYTQSAYVQNFSDGYKTASIKNNSFYVRAIRAF